MDLPIDADRTTQLVDHRKHDLVVEHDKIFTFHPKLVEGAEPLVQEATNCRSAFVETPRRPHVKYRIGSEEAHYRVDVTLIHGLEGEARTLNQVGCRGLLGHDQVSIAQATMPLLLPSERGRDAHVGAGSAAICLSGLSGRADLGAEHSELH